MEQIFLLPIICITPADAGDVNGLYCCTTAYNRDKLHYDFIAIRYAVLVIQFIRLLTLNHEAYMKYLSSLSIGLVGMRHKYFIADILYPNTELLFYLTLAPGT